MQPETGLAIRSTDHRVARFKHRLRLSDDRVDGLGGARRENCADHIARRLRARLLKLLGDHPPELLTVTASLKATVSVTTLPAFRLPLPLVMPDPEAAIEDIVGGTVSILMVWVLKAEAPLADPSVRLTV